MKNIFHKKLKPYFFIFLKKNWLGLLISTSIIVLFLYSRIYNLPERISFGWDQERDAQQIALFLKTLKPPLIGPRVLGPEWFFLGPYFTYMLTPFYVITSLHPYAIVVFTATYAVLFAVSSMYIVKRFFGIKAAVAFLLLWTFNPVLLTYDITAWNPLFIPLLLIILFFFLQKIYNNPCNKKYWLLAAVVLSLGIHMHIQWLFIIIFTAIFLLLSYKQISKYYANTYILILTALASLLPILVFDLRHDFLNSRLILKFMLQHTNEGVKQASIWIPVLLNMFAPILYTKSVFALTIAVLFFIISTLYFIYIKKGFFKIFFISTLFLFFITPIVFTWYGRRPSEYYFLYLYPFIFLIISTFFSSKYYLIGILATVYIIVINFNPVKNSIFSINGQSLAFKNAVIKQIAKSAKQSPVNITFQTDPGRDTGFRYLIEWYNIKQKQEGRRFTIIVPFKQTATKRYGDIGILAK